MGLTCSHQEVDGEGLEFQADPSLRGKAEVKKKMNGEKRLWGHLLIK